MTDMKTIRNLLAVCLLSALVMIPAYQAECYTPPGYKAVEHTFDKINLPENAYVFDYDVFSELSKMTDKNKKIDKDVQKVLEDTKIYHVSIKENGTYRNAAIVTMFLDNELLRSGKKNLTEEQKNRLRFRYGDWQKKDIEQIQSFVTTQLERIKWETKDSYDLKSRKIAKLSFNERSGLEEMANALVDYDWSGVDTMLINGNYGYHVSGKFAVMVVGLLADGFFDCYTYNVSDRGVGIVFMFSTDSEREYWKPIFKNAVNHAYI